MVVSPILVSPGVWPLGLLHEGDDPPNLSIQILGASEVELDQTCSFVEGSRVGAVLQSEVENQTRSGRFFLISSHTCSWMAWRCLERF